MHRSGTSLITQWLHRCGLFVGERLFPPGMGNVDGHFEDMDFLELHESFLRRRKLPISGFITDHIEDVTTMEKKELEKLIDRRKREHSEWGWKEPRTCLFFDVYRDIVPEAYYFVIVRDYKSTVNSMLYKDHKFLIQKINRKRGLSRIKWKLFKNLTEEEFYKKHAETYLKVWINYYEKILYHINLLPGDTFLVTNLNSLLQYDEYILNRVNSQWEFSLQYIPFIEVYKNELITEPKNINDYVKDISLLNKAKRIQEIISKFCVMQSI
jgi:hypothetical protein